MRTSPLVTLILGNPEQMSELGPHSGCGSSRRSLRSWAFDALLALLVTLVSALGSVGEATATSHQVGVTFSRQLEAHPPGTFYTLVVLGGLALVFRRRYPLGVLAFTVAMSGAYAAAGFVSGASLCSVYVALFTVGVLETRRVSITAGLVAIVVLFVCGWVGDTFWGPAGVDEVMPPLCVAAVALGIAVAGRRQAIAATIERAQRIEREHEEEARRRVDAERLRIARELHDVVAHTMSTINVQAGVAEHVVATQPDHAVEALSAIKNASREGLQELRAILNVLRQADDERGTSPAPGLSELEALAAATREAGVPTTVTVTHRTGVAPAAGGRGALPSAVELAAYRIVQESLTNVVRHAGPGAHATVTVLVGARRVLVQVDDDHPAPSGGDRHASSAGGRPARFDVEVGAGTGVTGMRERAAAFGGRLRAGPRSDGSGWRVRAVLTRADRPREPAAGSAGVQSTRGFADRSAPT